MKINIHNFGPIKNACIQLAPMTIFTGNSSLGKSYVNYLTYFLMKCTSMDELVTFFDSKKGRKDEFTMSITAIQSWMHEKVEAFMREFLNAPEITCNVSFELLPNDPKRSFHFKYEEIIAQDNNTDLVDDFLRDRKHIRVTIDDKIDDFMVPGMIKGKGFGLGAAFSVYIQNILFGKQIHQAMILPPARGAFVGENYTLKEKIASSVGMYRRFLNDYDYTTQFGAFRKKDANRYAEQIERLVGGRLITKEGKQYLVLKNNNELPLSAAASSIKELSPLLYTLQGMRRTVSFCIEEPEAHLHPQMQIAMIDLLATCFNDGFLFQFTTHSDYVMQRINQLVKLEFIRKNDKKQFEKICEAFGLTERHCIKKEDVKVYFFEVNEDGNVEIDDLQVDKEGFPLVTFFEVVNEMTVIEDALNNVIEDIKDKEGDGNKE